MKVINHVFYILKATYLHEIEILKREAWLKFWSVLDQKLKKLRWNLWSANCFIYKKYQGYWYLLMTLIKELLHFNREAMRYMPFNRYITTSVPKTREAIKKEKLHVRILLWRFALSWFNQIFLLSNNYSKTRKFQSASMEVKFWRTFFG